MLLPDTGQGMLPFMSTLQEIEAAVLTLTPEERQSLETLLRSLRAQEQKEEDELRELARRNGFNPFAKRSGAPVTTELVRQICEDEGI